MNEYCVIIPAVKKNVAFADDLVKKLHGITLIHRTIDKANAVAPREHVYVITDSEEITLMCKRAGVVPVYKKTLRLRSNDIIKDFLFFLIRISKKFASVIIIWPYSPLIDSRAILKAYALFQDNKHDVLVTVKEESHRSYKGKDTKLRNLIIGSDKEKLYVEQKGFLIFRSDLIYTRQDRKELKILPFPLPDEVIEIKNYQDWWVCEKLLKRKRIIFRVIGYDEVGMGHIYRSLALAHEITDHEIIFICDEKSNLALNKIAGCDYLIETVNSGVIEERILALKPHMVVNDMLNTGKEYVLRLKRSGVKVVSFEDLGKGAAFTDLTINELYDEPQMEGDHIKWGHQCFFLRDEFIGARPHAFEEEVQNLLITFGGTDPNNLAMKTLATVADFCGKENIHIYIVAGQGYIYKKELADYLRTLSGVIVDFTFATGIISEIMEKTHIAICSNGRTVYELAHMNIPAIVVSHHERENTHRFSCSDNGLVNIGEFRAGESESRIMEELRKFVHNRDYRKKLYDNMQHYNFLKNKNNVVGMILSLLEEPPHEDH